MKILVIGSGGREHALTWKLRESQHMKAIYCAPGNAGIAQEAECVPIDLTKLDQPVQLARELQADLTVVGPEAPLVAGLVDEFTRAGLAIIGPTKAAARLEGSKIFAKQFMQRHQIPTARFVTAEKPQDALAALRNFSLPVVIKADGLAGGKGSVIARSLSESSDAIDAFMVRKTLGPAGERVIIEEFLAGEELSFIVLTDSQSALPLAPTRDHKRLLDHDQGPNTGGMGAYSDDSILDDGSRDEILRRIVIPTLAAMAEEGNSYRGFLYFGLMLTADGPMLLEYNVRPGDPETQPTIMRLRSDLVELFQALREGHLGGVETHWSPNPAVCVVLASRGYPDKPEVGKTISGYDAAEALGGVKIFHAGTAFRDRRLLSAGGRVLGVTAIGEDLPTAVERAYLAVSKIQFEGMHYRRDIGVKSARRPSPAREPKRPIPQSGTENPPAPR